MKVLKFFNHVKNTSNEEVQKSEEERDIKATSTLSTHNAGRTACGHTYSLTFPLLKTLGVCVAGGGDSHRDDSKCTRLCCSSIS